MGKAKILSHIGDALYNVIYYRDMTVINKKRTQIENDIANANQGITDLNIEINNKTAEISILHDELNVLITVMQDCIVLSNIDEGSNGESCDSEKEAAKKKNVEYLVAKSELGDMETNLSNLKIRLQRLLKEQERLSGITEEEVKQIWCTDLCSRPVGYPDDGRGEIIPDDSMVGTIDIFNFSTRKYSINILPARF